MNGWCKLLQKYVCVWAGVHMCVHMSFWPLVCVCVCLVLSPRTGNKIPVFSSILCKCFFSKSTCSYKCNSNLRATRATVFWVFQHDKKSKLDWQQSHRVDVKVLKLCTGFSPVWIFQSEGGWIHIFTFSTGWWLTKHANTNRNYHQMHHDKKNPSSGAYDLETSVFKGYITKNGL